jgi:hypothetical protein
MTVVEYSTLVQTTLGGVLALGGAFLGQWWVERRAVAREQRDREHERDVWARDLGYEAHVQFIGTFQRLFKAVSDAEDRRDGSEPPEDYIQPLCDQMTSLRLISQQATQDKAKRAITALSKFTYTGGTWPEVDKFFDGYVGAVREEFHLPPIDFVEDGPPTSTTCRPRRSCPPSVLVIGSARFRRADCEICQERA